MEAPSSPLVTATFTVTPFKCSYAGSVSSIVMEAVFTCSSPTIGATCSLSKGISFPVTTSYTVRRAASITPPVTPNISAAPVPSPRGASNSPSGRFTKSMPAVFIIRASSLVVSTASTSRLPSTSISGRCISYFLAVQGMTDTTNMFSGAVAVRSA